MRKLLLSSAAWALAASAALAQVNSVPQVGVNTANLRQQTYSAVSVGLVPAASATDIFCIAGSTTRTVTIRRIEVSGTATTALTTPIVVLLRHSLDTGGTAATGTALPVSAPNNSTNQTPGAATLTAYTANPTINDSSPSYFRVNALNLSPAATAVGSDIVVWAFGTEIDAYEQGIDLVKGTTQQLCINLNAASVSGGSVSIGIEWTEQ
jgi:hypothetical protein